MSSLIKFTAVAGVLFFSQFVLADAPVLALSFADTNEAQDLGNKMNREHASIQAFNSNVKIDFIEGSESVVGLQFDLDIGEKFNRERVLSSCGGKLLSGHQLTCSITRDNHLRIIVASITNAPIRTGQLADISIEGLSIQPNIIRESVQMGNSQAQAVSAEIL